MHSFISCLVHCVWSTKNHAPVLNSNLRERLWPYLGGIAREKGMKALAASYPNQAALIPFWSNLKEGYDLFEKNRRVPRIKTRVDGTYSFSSF